MPEMHGIRKLPTFVFYKNGQQQKQLEFSGANIPKLEEVIQQHGTPSSFLGQGGCRRKNMRIIILIDWRSTKIAPWSFIWHQVSHIELCTRWFLYAFVRWGNQLWTSKSDYTIKKFIEPTKYNRKFMFWVHVPANL